MLFNKYHWHNCEEYNPVLSNWGIVGAQCWLMLINVDDQWFNHIIVSEAVTSFPILKLPVQNLLVWARVPLPLTLRQKQICRLQINLPWQSVGLKKSAKKIK